MESVFRFITVLLIFVFVIFITQITTKYIASFQKNQMKGGNIKILEAVRLNSNTYIQIVRISGKLLALAVSKDNVSVLCEIDEDDYQEGFLESSDAKILDFEEIFERAKKKFPRNKS